MPTFADDWKESCALQGNLAATIMKNRQHGIPMSQMMEVDTDPKIKDFMDALIIMAYESPRFSTEEMQKRSVDDFRDRAYLSCAKHMRSDK